MTKGTYFIQKKGQILVKLGLSVPQARIYCALAKMQNGTSATIATTADLARQQVYREMPNLLKLGFVEKIVTTPTKYRATPIGTCIKILKRRKSEEFSELKQAADNFLKEHDYRERTPVEEPGQLVIASQKGIIFKKYEREVGNAKVSIEAIGPTLANETALLMHNALFRKKNKQGVRIRMISEKLRRNKKILDVISKLQESPLFEIRELPNKPAVQLAIHDKKRVDIVVPDTSYKISDLWSNHPSIVTLAITYFEYNWDKAEKI